MEVHILNLLETGVQASDHREIFDNMLENKLYDVVQRWNPAVIHPIITPYSPKNKHTRFSNICTM